MLCLLLQVKVTSRPPDTSVSGEEIQNFVYLVYLLHNWPGGSIYKGLVRKEKTHKRQSEMSSSEKRPGKGLCGSSLSDWGPSSPRILSGGVQAIYRFWLWSVSPTQLDTPPPPIVQCTYVQSCIYLFTKGREEGRCWTREKGRGATGESTVHKAGSKIPTWLNVLLKTVSVLNWRKCRWSYSGVLF